MAQVYRDRDQFASLVREVAAPDVGRMGIEILSFTIKGKTTTTYLRIMPLCLFVCLFALRSDGNWCHVSHSDLMSSTMESGPVGENEWQPSTSDSFDSSFRWKPMEFHSYPFLSTFHRYLRFLTDFLWRFLFFFEFYSQMSTMTSSICPHWERLRRPMLNETRLWASLRPTETPEFG